MRTPTVAVLLSFLFLGCGSDTTAPDLTATSDNYVLRTINGGGLPATTGDEFTGNLAGGSLTIEGSGLSFIYSK